MRRRFLPLAHALPLVASLAVAAAPAPAPAPNAADRMFADYFAAETARLGVAPHADLASAADWPARRAADREQLFEMLGLSPRPEKTDLKPVVTGRVEHAEFTVEKLHFQSLPGLYVTANLYVPKNLAGRAPAILYGCGHASVKDGAASLGNKTGYQHHGAWFARHGYVCLVLDTIQLGELEGMHHGTRRFGQYWWNARGYTPAGVEAWNGIRALDYLQSRPEVDPEKIGMTGRSGGGAYTWYTAALDDRIKVAVPVAGITDLHNHVVDGIVKGHCDCMFMVNTYRWDYARLAALLAPRPLLLANSDKDTIFPLDGVLRVHRELARHYAALGAAEKLGLLITEGPHKDTQDLQVPAFRWFNRWLKGEPDTLVQVAAEKLFAPKQLRVFPVGGHPADERTTKIHDTFVPVAAPAVPADAAAWTAQRAAWLQALREKSFRGWPAAEAPLEIRPLAADFAHGRRIENFGFTSQNGIRLPLMIHRSPDASAPKPAKIILHISDNRNFDDFDLSLPLLEQIYSGKLAVAIFNPRGLGPTASALAPADQNEVRRRYLLLGQTVDGMRVWDIRRAVAALRSADLFGDTPIVLVGHRDQAVNAAYASLWIDALAGLELVAPPATHAKGPDYLNVLRFLDVPQAVALAAERHPVVLRDVNRDDWSWTARTAAALKWPADRLQW